MKKAWNTITISIKNEDFGSKINTLKENGYNLSALCRKAITEAYDQLNKETNNEVKTGDNNE